MRAAWLGLSRPDWARVVIGLAVAPPAAGVIVGFGFALLRFLPALLTTPVYGAAFGWPTAFAFGIPAYLPLRRWHVTSCLAFTAVGLLLGLAAAAIAGAASGMMCTGPYACRDSVLSIARGPGGAFFGALFGAVAGAVFGWLVRPADAQCFAGDEAGIDSRRGFE